MEPPAAVHAAAGYTLLSLSAVISSAAASHSSATPVVAGTRGDTPREAGPSLVVDYECESDEMADSLRLQRSPLTKKAQTNRREASLFIFGEDTPPTPVISLMPSPAQSPVRGKHDDVSHRGRAKSDTPAAVGISCKGDGSIPA